VAVYDRALREVSYKVIYTGCSMSGKTSNLKRISERTDPTAEGGLMKVSGDEHLQSLDLLRLSAGKRNGLNTRMLFYAVSAHAECTDSLRKLLKDADGVVFVVDSQYCCLDDNIDSYVRVWETLRSLGQDPEQLPIVLQANKRDKNRLLSITQIDDLLNHTRSPLIEACALDGTGVVETFDELLRRIMFKNDHLYDRTANDNGGNEEHAALLSTFDRDGGARFTRERSPRSPELREPAPRVGSFGGGTGPGRTSGGAASSNGGSGRRAIHDHAPHPGTTHDHAPCCGITNEEDLHLEAPSRCAPMSEGFEDFLRSIGW